MKKVIFMIASAAFLLSACGPGGSSKMTKMVDSCSVLKAINAEEVIGVKFAPAKSLGAHDGGKGSGKMSSCGLTSSAESDQADLTDLRDQVRNTWFVTLMAWTWPDEAGAQGYMDSMRLNTGNEIAPVDVSDLGDAAVWNGTMHVRTGNVTISLDVRGPADDKGQRSEKSLETELTRRALESLR